MLVNNVTLLKHSSSVLFLTLIPSLLFPDVMTGGKVSVAAYRQAARRACSASNVEQPWACADLVYIVTLLRDAYLLRDDEPVSVSVLTHAYTHVYTIR